MTISGTATAGRFTIATIVVAMTTVVTIAAAVVTIAVVAAAIWGRYWLVQYWEQSSQVRYRRRPP
ncbi:hypothetical protein C1Y08_18655 [Pseudomonas sp. FW306-02-F02-AA]|uniref:Transmembrane protein n=1 Tax=Pseudomonas fluorescens TaxID=294 RepID=A0A0N7H0Q5_PSEFL|nr:hypothetical protein AO353_22985 [Pseudomonas fluorescens]PMZ03031.1 hypothetical protein C1Y07_16985 [Pseudomonas sp. FW306-02-F02-AB]PMZ11882.1 hypothetical protein C1Y06_00235 [Pseudomonas sp. FW306-02-H06C]PMZ14442.1 hypothetical protein C1Y08_18655 [Pseudomonas sp. FW306-02-F02-AA]PMZ20483.1 hypothetical protein C1Y09_18760 [Pseudomonas sp. FW306-02-F08-AA]PMZ26805.1 hypothetical protein C1Y05_16015 [Pseudomonas sp. FW306-02-F04-BA]PMZ34374.1 hypothetical protein C1X99_11895 [Pseudomo